MTLFVETQPKTTPKPIMVSLHPWEYEFASSVGIRRFTNNWESVDANHYRDRKKMEDDRTAQVAAAICEIAVARAVNRYWSGHVWPAQKHGKYRKSVADVGKNIEVRRVREEAAQTFAVRSSDLGRSTFIIPAHPIRPEFQTVEIWGVISADDAWEIGEEVAGRDYRRVHRKYLSELDPTNSIV